MEARMPRPVLPATLSVDFSQVEERREGGGKAAHVPEGDYLLKVLGSELRSKKDDETSKYLSWRLGIVKPEKYTNAGVIYFVTSLKPEALWNLRNFLEDLGLTVPKSIAKVPIKQIVDKHLVFGATLEDDEYNNKVKSVVAATFKKSEYEDTGTAEDSDDDDEEEETANPTADTSDDDEDTEEIDIDDL
jgi:hypothetical protein